MELGQGLVFHVGNQDISKEITLRVKGQVVSPGEIYFQCTWKSQLGLAQFENPYWSLKSFSPPSIALLEFLATRTHPMGT